MFAESLGDCQSVPELVAAIRSWPEIWRRSQMKEMAEESSLAVVRERHAADSETLLPVETFHILQDESEAGPSRPCSLCKEPQFVRPIPVTR
jgi:hypothetical protein